MTWHKKGREGAGISLWFALFYSIFTGSIALAFVFMPKALMDQNSQPISVDQAVQAQQIESRLWITSQYTGRTNPFAYSDNIDNINKTYTKKHITYKVTLDGKSSISDEPFYKIAVPLATFKYETYVENMTVSVNGIPTHLTIEELYPKKYEIKK